MGLTTDWATPVVAVAQHLAETHPYSTPAIVVVVLYFTLHFFSVFDPELPKVSYPEVRSSVKSSIFNGIQSLDWCLNGHQLIRDGFKRYPKSIFQVPSQDRTSIVLPPKYLDEIRQLPASIANNSKSTSEFFLGSWTTLNMAMFLDCARDAVHIQYIAKIGQQLPAAREELTYAFNKSFPSFQDWTPVAIQPKILETVAQAVARAVVGPDLCRNPGWVKAVTGYAHNVFIAAISLKMMPSAIRPLLAIFTPFLYRIHVYRRSIRTILAPAINQRIAEKRDQPETWSAHIKQGQPSSLDWIVEKAPPEHANVKDIAHSLTGISFGASHTTSNHITNCLYDLAADFDHLAPILREEIETVLGSDRTTFSNADLSKLWKLDSFMKESQRFHPPSQLSVNRTLLKPYTLSSGEVIPAGVHISFPGEAMSISDDFFDNAAAFDAFRFERMRREHGHDMQGLQFAAPGPGTLHFGYGKQTCPGRFMGGLISKLTLIRILDRYDLKLKDGDDRPRNMAVMEMEAPDPTYCIMMRDRQL